ncbi:MAG: class I SAM-dependent methyltransferase, partial [Polyangiaceae bacterium]
MPELYRSPSFYERLFSQRAHDVEFYRWLAEGQEELLELGAGTGRVSLPLLKDGLRVVALERAPEMLEVLERRAEGLGVRERLTALNADFRHFEAPRRFRLAVCPFNG